MKVGLSYPGFHRRGGVERVFYECAKFLANHGHDVTVFASEWESECLPVTYERVQRRAGPSFSRPLSFFRECTRRMNAKSFDVRSAFGSECPIGGVFWAQSVHKAWLDRVKKFRAPMSYGRWKQRLNPLHPVLLHLEKRHFSERRHGKVIALTPEVKSDLQHFYEVPDEKIVVIPNGVSLEEFNVARCANMRSQVREELGYGDRDRVVIFVANETERKGLLPLVRAVSSLQDGTIKVLAVGRLNPNSIGQMGNVKFVGPASDVARYFAAADMFALPTQYEAWGLVIIEALACGLPVVVSRLAGASVAVEEGVTGELLDEPRDESEIATKLLRILDRSNAGRDRIASTIEHYSWNSVLSRYEQTLAECI